MVYLKIVVLDQCCYVKSFVACLRIFFHELDMITNLSSTVTP